MSTTLAFSSLWSPSSPPTLCRHCVDALDSLGILVTLVALVAFVTLVTPSTVLKLSTILAFSSLSSPSSPLSPLEPPSRCGAARPDPCLTSRRLNVSTPTQPGWCRQESRCVIERTSSGLPHIPHTDLPQHTPNHLISSSVAVCMWFSHNVTFPSMCISGLEPLPHHHHRYHRTSAFSRPAAVHSALYRSASARWH